MKPYELRLADLYCRNARYIKNLGTFCEDDDRFSRLHPDDRSLIREQLTVMQRLNVILEKRMRRLNIPV